jgi:hypothetical protein
MSFFTKPWLPLACVIVLVLLSLGFTAYRTVYKGEIYIFPPEEESELDTLEDEDTELDDEALEEVIEAEDSDESIEDVDSTDTNI